MDGIVREVYEKTFSATENYPELIEDESPLHIPIY
jgi:hypothetical protein